MKRLFVTVLLTIAALGCDASIQQEARDLDTEQSGLITYTGPNLKWVLWRRDGSATLTKRNRNTGAVTVSRSWSFSNHWRAVGVAGDKLLWQRTDIEQASLWTIDDQGNYAGHRYLNPQYSGYRAVSISAVDEGCSALLPAYRQYDIVYYRAGYYPYLQRVDSSGLAVASPSFIRQYEWNYELRDIRRDSYGKTAILWTNTAGNAIVTKIDPAQSWTILRRVKYRVAPNANEQQAPGNGFVATSFQTAQDTHSNVSGDNILFSRSDGQAILMSLNAIGEPYDEVVATLPGNGKKWSADSMSGADKSELLCFTPTQPPYGSAPNAP